VLTFLHARLQRRDTQVSDICVNFRSVVDFRQLLMLTVLRYRSGNRQCLIVPDIHPSQSNNKISVTDMFRTPLDGLFNSEVVFHEEEALSLSVPRSD
jgi:hypothetical protein